MYIPYSPRWEWSSHCTVRQSRITIADAWESQGAWARANCQNQARIRVEIMLAYPVILESDADYIMVTSPDFPELTTFGDDRNEALMRAVDAFEEAIAARIYDNRNIPKPSEGKPIIELPIRTVKKIVAYQSSISSRTHTTPRQRWTRKQDLAVLYLKMHYKKQLNSNHPDVCSLATAMNRSEASIWMRKGNFDSLDNSVDGIGLKNAAQLTKDVWSEYQSNPDAILAEARKAFSDLVKR